MRALIIGCGRIAGGYNEDSEDKILTHVVAYRRRGVDVEGCCDIDPLRAEAFAHRWGIPQWGTDAGDLLRVCAPDVVSVCAPPAAQHSLVAQIVASPAVKGLIVEKPLGVTATEAEVMASRLVAWGRPVVVNYFRSFDPAYREIADRARSTGFGPLRQVVAYYYGAAWTNASHLLERVIAVAGPLGAPYRIGSSGEAPAFAMSIGGGGTAVFLPVRGTDYSPLEIDFMFERGRCRMLDSEQRSEWHSTVGDPNFPGFATLGPVADVPGPTFHAFARPFEAIITAANRRSALELDTLTPSVEVTRILEAVLNS